MPGTRPRACTWVSRARVLYSKESLAKLKSDRGGKSERKEGEEEGQEQEEEEEV